MIEATETSFLKSDPIKVGFAYMIACRHKDAKKSRMLGKDGALTHLRIYALIFILDTEEKIPFLEDQLMQLIRDNPNYRFAARRV